MAIQSSVFVSLALYFAPVPSPVCAMSYQHMDETEIRLARRWVEEEGKTIKEAADLLNRHKSTVCRSLRAAVTKQTSAAGRPTAITPETYRKLKAAMDELLKKAKGEAEVTVKMIKARAKCQASERTIRDAFHANGVWFRRLKEKPILTPADMAERLEFGKQHAKRTKAQWVANPHAIIDNKHFQLYVNGAGRAHAARRRVRGAYRSAKDGLKPHLVKPKGTLKFPAKSVQVTAAIVNGRIRMWHYVVGRWNGEAAAKMYRGPLAKAVKKAFPGKRSWVVMEDNDPAGYKSAKGMEAKAAAKFVTMSLPKRSPDCNPLDYSIWKEINDRMRAKEESFAAGFKESEEAFLKRLRHTAMNLPQSLVTKVVGDMSRRMKELVDNKGGLVHE